MSAGDQTPEVEFIDLDAVEQVVETVLYDEECDELDTFTLTAGAEPFVLLQLAQVPGENALAYQIAGSLLNSEEDLLNTIEGFAAALRAKIEADAAQAEAIKGEVTGEFFTPADDACSCGGRRLDVNCTPECDLNG